MSSSFLGFYQKCVVTQTDCVLTMIMIPESRGIGKWLVTAVSALQADYIPCSELPELESLRLPNARSCRNDWKDNMWRNFKES